MAQYQEQLTDLLEKFLKKEYTTDKTNYDVILDFLIEPKQDIYIKTINILYELVDESDIIIKKDSFRVVCTIPDGTVWFDSSKGSKNTWENFQAKSINENHNTRAPFMSVLLKNDRTSFETKYSSSTKVNEYRLTYRFGVNKSYPLGVIGYSFSRKEI
jgi:hypothetical protein